jgi:hypothetical protein
VVALVVAGLACLGTAAWTMLDARGRLWATMPAGDPSRFRPTTSRRTTMKTALVCLLSLTAAAAAADVSGNWVGTYDLTFPDGQAQSGQVYMTLKQAGSEITGTAGPAEQQWPITNGKIDRNRITFDLQSDGPLYKVELTLAEGRLKGEATGQTGDGTLKATLELTKRAE